MSTLTGTGKLVRLILRRDRVVMPVWILSLSLIMVSFAASYAELFPTAAARQSYADASAANAAFVALYGRLSGSSLGELVAWRAGFIPVMVGLIGLLTVIRHTRTEEETGRRELLGATVVGRHAGLAAALIATAGALTVLAGLVALGLISQGLPAAGSLALGLELAAPGLAFAAVGAVTAQLTSSAGSARGIAVSLLGLAYLLRVVGDISAQAGGSLGWLSWLSPIGWAHRIEPYGGDHWWPLALVAGFTALLTWLAVALSARRDVGAGLLPARSGPAVAGPGLRSPLGLAWRLHRSLLAGWIVGFALVGVVFGGVANSIGDLVENNQNLRDMFVRLGGQSGLIDAFLASTMGLLGLIASAYAVQAGLRLRAEETAGRAEPVLATAVSRLRWTGSHLAFSALGPAAALLAGGLTAGLTYGASVGDVGRELPRVLGGALVQLPAVWVLTGLTLALFGLLPRLVAAVTWGAVALCLIIGLVGSTLQLDQAVLDLSPFTHIPKIPGPDVSLAPLVWLAAVALALGLVGLAGVRRRDIPVP